MRNYKDRAEAEYTRRIDAADREYGAAIREGRGRRLWGRNELDAVSGMVHTHFKTYPDLDPVR